MSSGCYQYVLASMVSASCLEDTDFVVYILLCFVCVSEPVTSSGLERLTKGSQSKTETLLQFSEMLINVHCLYGQYIK